MVEVFKTNVERPDDARILLHQIHSRYQDYTANFDLEDCDRILRVESRKGLVEVVCILNLLRESGFKVEVLSDDKPVNEVLSF